MLRIFPPRARDDAEALQALPTTGNAARGLLRRRIAGAGTSIFRVPHRPAAGCRSVGCSNTRTNSVTYSN